MRARLFSALVLASLLLLGQAGVASAQTATVQHLWATSPGYKVAYNEINNGANTPATSGSVIGPYADVRNDVLNAEISMYTGGVKPAAGWGKLALPCRHLKVGRLSPTATAWPR